MTPGPAPVVVTLSPAMVAGAIRTVAAASTAPPHLWLRMILFLFQLQSSDSSGAILSDAQMK
jgi:hypothetical protein